MKRIEFIAPVEAIRGNLSGRQNLGYAPNLNPAWDVPTKNRTYAQNYAPRFIGAKVSRTGLKYFAVKTRTAVTMTDALRLGQALLSMSSLIAKRIEGHLDTLTPLQAMYAAAPENKMGWTWHRWVVKYVRLGLETKSDFVFRISALSAETIKYANPFIEEHAEDVNELSVADLQYLQDKIVKFWMQLATAPVVFTIDGVEEKGVCHENDSFATLATADYNVLGISIEGESGSEKVCIGDHKIQRHFSSGWQDVAPNAGIGGDVEYRIVPNE